MNYTYRYRFPREMSDMGSLPDYKRKNDAQNTGGPVSGLFTEKIKVITQSHQKVRPGSLAFSRLELHVNPSFDSHALPHKRYSKAAWSDPMPVYVPQIPSERIWACPQKWTLFCNEECTFKWRAETGRLASRGPQLALCSLLVPWGDVRTVMSISLFITRTQTAGVLSKIFLFSK